MASHKSPLSSAARVTRNTAAGIQNSTHDLIEHHPIPTGLVVFAAGLAAGTLIGCALSGGTRSTSPNMLAEGIGSRVLDSLSSVMPDAMPDALSKRMTG